MHFYFSLYHEALLLDRDLHEFRPAVLFYYNPACLLCRQSFPHKCNIDAFRDRVA